MIIFLAVTAVATLTMSVVAIVICEIEHAKCLNGDME